MSESDLMLQTSLHFYAREGYYQHVLRLTDENGLRFVNDPVLQFFCGVSQLMQAQNQGAIRAFSDIQDHPDVMLGALFGKIDSHKRAANIDKEEVRDLEAKLRIARRTSNEKSNYYGALFLYLTDGAEKACEYVEKALKMNGTDRMFLCLKGWVDLTIGRDIKSALESFEHARGTPCQWNSMQTCNLNLPILTQPFPARDSDDLFYLDPWLGSARYFERRHNSSEMLDILGQASSRSTAFSPLIQCERLRALLLNKDWDQCLDTAHQCLLVDSECIPAHVVVCVYSICIGDRSKDTSELSNFVELIDRIEPRNASLYRRLALLLSRICGRNPDLLQYTRHFCDRAVTVERNAENLAELGLQLRMLGLEKPALKAYQNALELDATTDQSLLGESWPVIWTRTTFPMLELKLISSKLHIENYQMLWLVFLEKSLLISLVRHYFPMLLYMEALIAKRNEKPYQEVMTIVKTVLDAHLTKIQHLPYGLDYIRELNPDFILELVNELFDYVPIEPAKPSSIRSPILQEIERILAVVNHSCPGLSDASYLLGKALYLAGEIDQAQDILRQCLEKNQTFSDAHLLMAQIHLQKNQFKQASQSLEVGLSFNFQVREHPLYHLIKAKIQKRSNHIEGAVQQLQTAMALSTFKKDSTTEQKRKTNKSGKISLLEMTESDRVTVYLELIDCLQIMEKTDEAAKLMHDALDQFRGKYEKQQLMLCNADLMLTRGDADRALSLLASVTPDQASYLLARQKMAEIYLHHKKDKLQFAICYKELVETNPSPQAFVLLGDAYMSIQEPERAIEVYEAALKRNPKDHALARKIGQAYVQAHLYSKAVNYYEAALKTGQQGQFRQDLAELLLKLRNFDKCERILKQGFEKDGEAVDAPTMIDEVKYLVLLSKLHFETGNWQQAMEELIRAKDQQIRVVKKVPSEVPDFVEQRKFVVKICCQLGDFYQNQRLYMKAIDLYREALSFAQNDSKIMLSLAHLYLTIGNLDDCNRQCEILLRIDKNNEQATLMLADLMYQKNEIEQASMHFSHLLDRNPNQYHALARCIELNCRNGDIDKAEKYLDLALERNPRATVDAGYNYCKGLHEWCTGDPTTALNQFNRARRDLEWGERAIYNMIEICLNPDNEIIGGEVFEHGDENVSQNADENAREMGTRAAENFLKELRFKPGLDYKYRLMDNFILLATKNRTNIDEAMLNFTQMAGNEEKQEEDDNAGNVGAVLGLARGFMIRRATQKAKIQLKRVMNHQWTLEDADYLEQCWLLLADIYINQRKYDQATGILQKILRHNASCIKAFEYMGYLRENEQKWADAAANYEEAWAICKKRNPTIGYKLGYNYLKSRRFFDAIEVCHRVLELFPKYPKIRRDILDKARANIRI